MIPVLIAMTNGHEKKPMSSDQHGSFNSHLPRFSFYVLFVVYPEHLLVLRSQWVSYSILHAFVYSVFDITHHQKTHHQANH